MERVHILTSICICPLYIFTSALGILVTLSNRSKDRRVTKKKKNIYMRSEQIDFRIKTSSLVTDSWFRMKRMMCRSFEGF